MSASPVERPSCRDDLRSACVMAYELALFAEGQGYATSALLLRQAAESLAIACLDAALPAGDAAAIGPGG